MTMDFSFEDLYEILRAEKYSTDLQELGRDILKKICTYMRSKEEFLVRQKDSTFDETIDKTKTELDNAKRALKDLYDKRERKVISRALFTARGGFKLKDTTNMLISEEKLYFAILEMIKRNGEEFFNSLNRDYSEAPSAEPKALKDAFKRLKLADAVPELRDMKLNKYGPFEANAEVDLPAELADLLIKQGKATEIISVEARNDEAMQNENN